MVVRRPFYRTAMARPSKTMCIGAIMFLDSASSSSCTLLVDQKQAKPMGEPSQRHPGPCSSIRPSLRLRGGANFSRQTFSRKRAWETAVKRGKGGFPGPMSWEPMDAEELRVKAESLLTSEIPDPVIEQFVPTRAVLWRKWKGTMLEDTWEATVLNMGVALVVCLAYQRLQVSYPRLSEQLFKIDVIWKIHMTLTTFILTFFVSQSYAMWRSVYKTTRHVQGKLYNLLMLTTTHLRRERSAYLDDATGTSTAATGETGGGGERALKGEGRSMRPDRDKAFGRNVGRGGDNVGIGRGDAAWFVGGGEAGASGGGGGKASPLVASPPPPPPVPCTCGGGGTESMRDTSSGGGGGSSKCGCEFPGKSVLLDSRLWLAHFERYTRLWQILYYAGCSRKHACFCTDSGLERLHLCGLITEAEIPLLKDFPGPVAHRHMPVFQWMVALYLGGLEEGRFLQPVSLTTRMMEQFVGLRDKSGGIGDMVGGRTKLAYAHAVQLLVDVFLLLTPFALFSEVGFWSIVATGVLTTFYQGLFNLSKTFIDPLNNEDATIDSDCIVIDSLIKESANMGSRWTQGAKGFPF
ncbi:unnamed protein product [Ectocarpus sp. 12 AP-2014]